jgi:methyl-accepting chemotaxis protein
MSIYFSHRDIDIGFIVNQMDDIVQTVMQRMATVSSELDVFQDKIWRDDDTFTSDFAAIVRSTVTPMLNIVAEKLQQINNALNAQYEALNERTEALNEHTATIASLNQRVSKLESNKPKQQTKPNTPQYRRR